MVDLDLDPGSPHAGWEVDAEAILLCESDGTPEEVAEEIARMLDVLTGCGATRMEVSRDEAQRLKFQAEILEGRIEIAERMMKARNGGA